MTEEILYSRVPYSKIRREGVRFDGKQGWGAAAGIGGFHTWNDWEAYWTDVSIAAPETEICTVNIPGRHGLLDLSEALTGSPVYKNRTVSLTFVYPGSGSQWHDRYSEMLYQLHGRVVQMVMDSDPGYYYEGRCTVSSQRNNGAYSTFVITLDAYPYKYETADSLGDWLWDPLHFENGVIREYGHLTIPAGGTLSVRVIGSPMLTQPRIAVNAPCTVTIGEVCHDLRAGVNPNVFSLWDEEVTLEFSNTSENDIALSIDYRGGKL